eukprot:363749-Chlamydomonas_euryale.AAC.10
MHVDAVRLSLNNKAACKATCTGSSALAGPHKHEHPEGRAGVTNRTACRLSLRQPSGSDGGYRDQRAGSAMLHVFGHSDVQMIPPLKVLRHFLGHHQHKDANLEDKRMGDLKVPAPGSVKPHAI